MKKKQSNVKETQLQLYAVTDRKWLKDRELSEVVEDAILGGATFIQLREKHLEKESFLEEARKIKAVTDRYQIPFVIDDDVEIAKEVGADGVHVGQDDMSLAQARTILGPDKIIGVSAHNLEEAKRAEEGGADYLGVGACFSTMTKTDTQAITKEELRKITESVHIPVVAIGGISRDRISELSGCGISGVAVVSAIFAEDEPREAAKQLKIEVKKYLSCADSSEA